MSSDTVSAIPIHRLLRHSKNGYELARRAVLIAACTMLLIHGVQQVLHPSASNEATVHASTQPTVVDVAPGPESPPASRRSAANE
jgi:hypothetical protein